MSDDNIVDFDELIDRKLDREDEAMLRAERDAYCVGELVHARLECTATVLVVGDLLGHTGTSEGAA